MLPVTVQRVQDAMLRRIRHRYVLYHARRQSERALSRGTVNVILVLCYGNIYRSPLVEYLLRHSRKFVGVTIKSAGFFHKPGRPCDGDYLLALKERGYDLSSHRSTVVSRDDLIAADIIIIMDRKNWDQLRRLEPKTLEKVIWIGAFNPTGSVEVADPYGTGFRDTQEIIKQLENGADSIARALPGLIKQKTNTPE